MLSFNKTRNDARQGNDRMQHIRFRPQILNLLQRIYDGRCLLSISLANHSHRYNSALLKIDAEQAYLLLDEFKPDSGHTLFLQQQRCRVQAGIKGISISFIATLIDSGRQNDIAYYRVRLPDTLSYGQRRAHFRPRVSRALGTEVHLEIPAGDSLRGTLQDISLGGLRVKTSDAQADLPAGTPRHCRFTLPDGTLIHGPIELRFLSHGDDGCQLGGRFLQLPPTQRRALQKFIAELEREALRKTPRDG